MFRVSPPQEGSGFSSLGILNFDSIRKPLSDPIGYPGSQFETPFPCLGNKPSGGTDVGHMMAFKNKPFIIKTGITLSCLGQALGQHAKGNDEDAQELLGFVISNFTRITHIKDQEEIARLTNVLKAAFAVFTSSELGLSLLTKTEPLTTHDIYQIYLFLLNEDNELKNIIGLPAFADVISGSYSQQFNNVFQKFQDSEGTLASQRLFIQPKNAAGFFMGSHFLDTAIPFDHFLLQHFINQSMQGLSQEEWIAQGAERLTKTLTEKPITGLCAAILIRHIMGENSDLGPDNMLLVPKSNGSYHLTNIDLTGFRYQRRDEFEDKYGIHLGWKKTLAEVKHPDHLISRLFSPTVFSSRFIKYNPQTKDYAVTLKEAIYSAICDVLSKHVIGHVSDEVSLLIDWLAKLNYDLVSNNLKSAMRNAYDALNPHVKFDEKYLSLLIEFNESFISHAILESQQVLNQSNQPKLG